MGVHWTDKWNCWLSACLLCSTTDRGSNVFLEGPSTGMNVLKMINENAIEKIAELSSALVHTKHTHWSLTNERSKGIMGKYMLRACHRIPWLPVAEM